MQTEYAVHPYVGVEKIKFNSSEQQIIEVVGEPQKKLKTYFGDKRFEYAEFGIIFENEGVAEITFLPEANLTLNGHNFFNEKDIVKFLKEYDSSPIKVDDWLVFNEIGVTICNFDKPDQTSIVSVYKRNYWDDFIASNKNK